MLLVSLKVSYDLAMCSDKSSGNKSISSYDRNFVVLLIFVGNWNLFLKLLPATSFENFHDFQNDGSPVKMSTITKKESFSLNFFSVTVKKSPQNCGSVLIY